MMAVATLTTNIAHLINIMVKIGKYNTLSVVKYVDFGVYLDGGDGLEILLPTRYVPDKLNVGDDIEVFIYKDSEDRIIATTEHPYAQVGEFAYLQVNQVNQAGAFLDWGLPKDLLVPYSQQRSKMRQDGIYLVYVYLDDATKRIVATAKIEKYLDNVLPEYKQGEKVNCLVFEHTDIGYKVIVNNMHRGMIYHNEIFQPIEVEQQVVGYVKAIREDGKLDITLSDKAAVRIDGLSSRILNAIKSNGGKLNLNDKSSPDEIKALFSCSKKDFKKAIGHLYKEHLINILPDSIVMV
jgi:predicted RNA-binding protein (virulence factor B family)